MPTTTIFTSFRSFDGSTVYTLGDGRIVRRSILGLMLLDGIGGKFVRFLDAAETAELNAAVK